MIRIPIYDRSQPIATEGRYVLTISDKLGIASLFAVSYPNRKPVSVSGVPAVMWTEPGAQGEFQVWLSFDPTDQLTANYQVTQARISLTAVLQVVSALAVVTAGAIVLTKAEKVVNAPAVTYGALALLIGVGVLAYMKLRSA